MNNPIVMLFLTKGGYVVDVEFKKFVDKTNGIHADIEEVKKAPPTPVDDFDFDDTKVVEANPVFQRQPDPIEHLDEPKEEQTDEVDIQVGDMVEWKNELGVHYQDVVEEIDEENQQIKFVAVEDKVLYDKLVKIIA
jgi:transcription antitermination factor NusG